MDPIISKMNREILEFINHMDADPDAERPTTFWFYSESEENIYRLAHHLQELNMRIEYCGHSPGDAPEYLLIAEKWMRPINGNDEQSLDLFQRNRRPVQRNLRRLGGAGEEYRILNR